MKREIKICTECESEYFADTSKMKELCPDCSHYLYGYENCNHQYENNRCIHCNRNRGSSAFVKELKKPGKK